MANIDESTFEAVNNADYLNIGEFGSRFAQSLAEDGRIASKQMTNNMVMASNRFNSAMDSAVLRITKGLVEPDIEEGAAVSKMETGVDKSSQAYLLANAISQLNSALSTIQGITKTAQSTPKETGN